MAKVKCPRCFYINPDGQEACLQCKTPLPRIKIEAMSRETPAGAASANAVQFRRGQMVADRYTVLNIIGRGGMGTIYKVHDNTLGEEVALKTLLPQFVQDKLIVERFFNEARIARKLAHPNIVRVHDIGMSGETLYISMEYIEGRSLRGLLESLPPGQRLPIKQVLQIFDELCAALEYAHQHTVHRDIKPENVMVCADGSVRLMDFGISKLMANTRLTGASIVMGTPFYMSPEQLRNSRDADARSDIYSVGVMLYEVLTGNMPTGIPKAASEMIKDLPPELDNIVARCVQPDPLARYQNASELRTALLPLRQLMLSGGDTSHIPTTRRRKQSWPLRKTAGISIAALLIAGMAGGMFELERARKSRLAQAMERADVSVSTAATAYSPAKYQSLIAQVRERAGMRASTLASVQEMYKTAETRWAATVEGDIAGRPESDLTAAMREYMAILLWQDGLVFIPDGEVTIGGAPVFVPAFLIEDTESTIAQFSAFCQEVAGGWKFPEELAANVDENADLPITMVTYYDAQAFAAHRGRLIPTDAQWARAAYGFPDNASDTFPWGAEWSSGSANTGGAMDRLAKVKAFPADRTSSACWDMAGNAAEWTRTPAKAGGGEPFFGQEMITRGGDFSTTPIPLRESRPESFDRRDPVLGFRCVLEIPTDPVFVEEWLKRPF